ncbi:MAG: hypothetical protein RKP20_00785 [Candidatus Competibacter sp.]|nr:hypothetical protein [Candidatus Competibacter sp.]
MRQWLRVIIVTSVLANVPWMSLAEEKTPPQKDKAATATTPDEWVHEDTKFQESLNSLGLTAGYAGKCKEKNAEAVEQITAQALAAADQLVRLFGTDAAFRFVFYAGLGAGGLKLDDAKCAQYIANWTEFVKEHPELKARETREKK